MVPIGLYAKAQTIDGEAGVLGEAQTLHVDIQGIVGERSKVDVPADVVEPEVGHVEMSFSLGLVVLVVIQAGVADDERVDPNVEGLVRSSVLRGERVKEELEVWLCLGI